MEIRNTKPSKAEQIAVLEQVANAIDEYGDVLSLSAWVERINCTAYVGNDTDLTKKLLPDFIWITGFAISEIRDWFKARAFRLNDGEVVSNEEYWLDNHANQFPIALSQAEAVKQSLGNTNCFLCINCSNCSNSIYCSNCSNCINCRGCIHCSNCSNCMSCMNCSNCSEAARCVNCDNCNQCRSCKDCVKCNNCVGCRNCTDCRECHICQDCQACRGGSYLINGEKSMSLGANAG